MSSLGFVPAAPYVVPAGSAALSGLSKILTSSAAGLYVWSRFRDRERGRGRGRIEGGLGLIPADEPEIPNGNAPIRYRVRWGGTLTKDGEDSEEFPPYSFRTRTGPLNVRFESVNGGSFWKLDHASGTDNMVSSTRQVSDGWFMNLTFFEAIPLDPDEEGLDEQPETYRPPPPRRYWEGRAAAQGVTVSERGTLLASGSPSDGGSDIAFEYGDPKFNGRTLDIPVGFGGGVTTGDGRRSPGPRGTISFDFGTRGSGTPRGTTSGTTTRRGSATGSPVTTPTGGPVRTPVTRGSGTTVEYEPGVTVSWDWTPESIAELIPPPNLEFPEPFPDIIPDDIEFPDWDPEVNVEVTVESSACPDPCLPGGGDGIECEFPELADPVPMAVGVNVNCTIPVGNGGLTRILGDGGNLQFYVPRLCSIVWVTGDGRHSSSIDVKTTPALISPPDFSGEWVSVEVVPSRGVTIETEIVEGVRYPDIRFKE